VAWDDTRLTVEALKLTSDIDIEAPVAAFTATPAHGNAPLTVEFDANDSFVRGGGSFVSFAWDFNNDGNIDETNVNPTASHLYSSFGEHNPRLIATATNGYTDEHIAPVYCHGWAHSWGGLDDERIADIVTVGNRVYTAGRATPASGKPMALIACFDAWGHPLWQRAVGGSEADWSLSLAASDSEAVVMTATSESLFAPDFCILTVAFSSTGDILWQRAWNSPGADLRPRAAADAAGNIYIAGYSDGFRETGDDLVLLKYSPTGILLWQQKISSSISQSFPSLYLYSGNLYLAAMAKDLSSEDEYLAVLKLDLDGNIVAQALPGVPARARPLGIRSDLAGDIFITGELQGYSDVAFLTALDNTLEVQWFKSWGYPLADAMGKDLLLTYDTLTVDRIVVAGGLYNELDDILNGALFSFNIAGDLQQAWSLYSITNGSLLYAIHAGTGGSLLLGGQGLNNEQEFSVSSPIVSNVVYGENPHTASASSVSATLFAPSDEPGIPTGVTNSGGGGTDLLILGIDISDL
jgi:hypothetical protein